MCTECYDALIYVFVALLLYEISAQIHVYNVCALFFTKCANARVQCVCSILHHVHTAYSFDARVQWVCCILH